MYFASRMQAGRMLASQLVEKYRYEDCAVIALNDGGAVVGAQIAVQLHSVLMMLMSEEINLPREIEAIGAIAQDGSFTYNQGSYADSEIEELMEEYFGFVEQEKLSRIQDLQHLVGSGGSIKKELIKGRNIILVSDGFQSGFALDIALTYLKPVAIEKIIVATPLASVKAVDRMHIVADDLYVLSVIENYMDTDHYYDTQDVPEHAKVLEIIEKIILEWQ
ncbi:MAG TPA: phosphoribosyltransferase family protein [Candidatus Microsaccharimonas sp.]|nr:phosphoribosyltransferase family protein [Candidatus Microsaccharimonas sp.]